MNENDLIDGLHYLSTFIQKGVRIEQNVKSLIFIDNEVLCDDRFLQRDDFIYQKQLLEADPKRIDLVLSNLSIAIANNCGNDIDLAKYSQHDNYDYNCTINENEGSVAKRYTITKLEPKDEQLFKKLWLRNFMKKLKNVDSLIREILDLNQEEIENTPLEKKIGKADFENNFDHVPSKSIYNHFHEGLVNSGSISQSDLHKYLLAAFELKKSPKVLFTIGGKLSKRRVYNVFYYYYKDVSGKHYGTQKKYVALLGDYFEGYDNKIISTNWSK